MTRAQLIEKRKKKKRRQLLVKAGIGASAAVIFLLIMFVIVPQIRGIGRKTDTGAAENAEAASVDTDTAQKISATDGRSGKNGWNVSDAGWWYQNNDNTVFASGWKTIDGQQYYFTDQGYMATGWVNTGNVMDSYFDASGILDTTKKQKLVALTFDDGPSQNTDTILDALEKYDAKATFFVVGTQAEYYTDQLKREADLGMEIGNHTYEHQTLKYQDADTIVYQLNKNDEVINNLCGVTPTIMRPTGGGVDETVAKSVTKPMIEWNIDTLDWETKDVESTYDTVLSNVSDGSIVLMHDLYEATAEAAVQIIPALKEEGYKMVTVSELAEAYGYTLEKGGLYFDFLPGGKSEDNKSPSQLLEAVENGYTA